MDGGGRLDQPLMRSGQLGDREAGAPDRELVHSHVGAPRRRRILRPYWQSAYGAMASRWTARLRRLPLPPGIGIVGTVLLIVGALSYGVVGGRHVPDVIDLGQGHARRRGGFAWFPHCRDFADRLEGSQPGETSHDRRRHRSCLAVVPDADARARNTDVQSVDRRCGGTQALSRSAANYRHRAPGFCAVAEGRARQRHCIGRDGARTVRRGPLPSVSSGRDR